MTTPFESFESLIAWRPAPTVQYIGSDILLENTKMMIFAAPKMFKSLAAAQLSLCLASGQDWLGFKTIQCKVAYLQSEVPKKEFRDRLYKMGVNAVVPPNTAFFITDSGFKLDNQAAYKALQVRLDHLRPKILILDPWYKMLSREDNQHYSQSQDLMDALIKDFNLSIIMIHHDTVPQYDYKAGKHVEFFHPRGPRTVEGWFDSIIELKGDIQTDDRVLNFELRHAHYLPKPMSLKLDRTKLWLERTP